MSAPGHFRPERWAMLESQSSSKKALSASSGAVLNPPVQPRAFMAASTYSDPQASSAVDDLGSATWQVVMSDLARIIKFDGSRRDLNYDRTTGRLPQINLSRGPYNVILSDAVRFLEQLTHKQKLNQGTVLEEAALYRLKKLLPKSYLEKPGPNPKSFLKGYYKPFQDIRLDTVLVRSVISYINDLQAQQRQGPMQARPEHPPLQAQPPQASASEPGQNTGSRNSGGTHLMVTRSQTQSFRLNQSTVPQKNNGFNRVIPRIQTQLLDPNQSTDPKKNVEPSHVKQEHPQPSNWLPKLIAPQKTYQELLVMPAISASTRVSQKRQRLQPKAVSRNAIEQALLKMSKWIETWQSGMLGNTDLGWKSFEKCLAWPDIVEPDGTANTFETRLQAPFTVSGSKDYRGEILDEDSSSDDASAPAFKRQKLRADRLPSSSPKDNQSAVTGTNDGRTQVRGSVLAARCGFRPATLRWSGPKMLPSSSAFATSESSIFDQTRPFNSDMVLIPRVKHHIPEVPTRLSKPRGTCGSTIKDMMKLRPPIDRTAEHEVHAHVHPLEFDKKKHLQGIIIDREGDFRMHDETFLVSESEDDPTASSACCADFPSTRTQPNQLTQTSTKYQNRSQPLKIKVTDIAATETKWHNLSTDLSDRSKRHGLSVIESPPAVNIPREVNPRIRWPRPIPGRVLPVQVVAQTATEYDFGTAEQANAWTDTRNATNDCAQDIADVIQAMFDGMPRLDSDPVILLKAGLLSGHILLLLAMSELT